MRRRITAVLAVCAAFGTTAAPALAGNTGNQPPGPPFLSGGQGAIVFHCNAIQGHSVTVVNSQGAFGQGDCAG